MVNISVVIPLYNKESFIINAVRSVLNQSYPNFEIIIVDDGSTDDSVRQLAGIHDPRIRLLRIKNSGVSVARNTGIRAANYDWIAFLDADDWWAVDFLYSIATAILSFPNENVFATGFTRVFSNNEDRYANKFLPKDGETSKVDYFKIIGSYELPPLNSSNTIVRRDRLVEAGLFRIGQRHYEDHDLWIRLCTEDAVVFINSSLSFYRKTSSNTVSSSHYDADDFMLYLSTISDVRSKLDKIGQRDFQRYLNKFSLLTYLKNSGNYSKKKEKAVAKTLKRIINGRFKMYFTIIQMVPFNLYRFYTSIKKISL